MLYNTILESIFASKYTNEISYLVIYFILNDKIEAFACLFFTVTKIAEYETNTFHAFTKLVLKFYFTYKCIF
jgi:hypothetical protein